MNPEIIQGIISIFSPFPFMLLLIGTFAGIIFGAIPGMTATMGIVLFLPLTFKIDPVSSICLLLGIYTGGISGGLVSAALLRMPGTPSSVATTFDAYPMAQKGEPGRALGIGIFASFIGGLFSSVALIFVAPQVAKIALTFGNFEYFSVSILALSIVVVLSKKSMTKGLLATFIGLFFATVGSSEIDMVPRFTFGFEDLEGGFNIMPYLIGLYAISQIISDMGSDNNVLVPKVPIKNVWIGFRNFFKGDLSNVIQSTLIGFFIGLLPGIGGATANVVSYGNAKSHSKHPELFGTGYKSGIIASEASNNAVIAGALVPMLTMGIPGDATTAVLVGALMIHGLQPGPMLFNSNAMFVYSTFSAVFFANLAMFIMMLVAIKFFIKALSTPKTYLLPFIVVMCVVGAYALNNRIFDIWLLLFFGLVGYCMERLEFPMTPAILGFVLAPLIENNLRQGLMSSNGSYMPLLEGKISLCCLILTAISLAWPLVSGALKKRKIRVDSQ